MGAKGAAGASEKVRRIAPAAYRTPRHVAGVICFPCPALTPAPRAAPLCRAPQNFAQNTPLIGVAAPLGRTHRAMRQPPAAPPCRAPHRTLLLLRATPPFFSFPDGLREVFSRSVEVFLPPSGRSPRGNSPRAAPRNFTQNTSYRRGFFLVRTYCATRQPPAPRLPPHPAPACRAPAPRRAARLHFPAVSCIIPSVICFFHLARSAT